MTLDRDGAYGFFGHYITLTCSGKIVDDTPTYDNWLVLTTTPVILRGYHPEPDKCKEKLRQELLIQSDIDIELNRRQNCFIAKTALVSKDVFFDSCSVARILHFRVLCYGMKHKKVNFTFLEKDMERLPFRDNKFDLGINRNLSLRYREEIIPLNEHGLG